jgi:hypothetical protein
MNEVNTVLDLPLSWDGNSFRFTFYVNNVLKWGGSRLITSGVFSGSNDRGNTFFYKTACMYINEIKKYHKVSLYSVIGGCFFYDLVREVDFDRVVLFDENMAEFGKLAYVLNSVKSDGSATAADITNNLDSYVINNPSCILPEIGNEYIDIDFTQQSMAGAMFAGTRVNDKSLLLSAKDYPECVWTASQEDVNIVYSRLKKSLVRKIYTRVPTIDAGKSFAVVFISNADISTVDIKKLITNHSGLLVIRSISHFDFRHVEPHIFWDSVAMSCFVGKTHQCWNNECVKNSTNEALNQFVNSSSFIDDNNILKSLSSIPKDTSTILTHILLGHSKEGKLAKMNRLEVVKGLLENVPVHIKRLVVAEFNPEGEMCHSVYPFTSVEQMKDQFTQSVKKSGLHYVETKYAPGNQDVRRNVFFVFDRKP